MSPNQRQILLILSVMIIGILIGAFLARIEWHRTVVPVEVGSGGDASIQYVRGPIPAGKTGIRIMTLDSPVTVVSAFWPTGVNRKWLDLQQHIVYMGSTEQKSIVVFVHPPLDTREGNYSANITVLSIII
ncbi:MAG TPA: hypothetical protein VJK52_03385 [Candidatus Nanoarchaeia archaeon]|nr:hypothetical protein [Candidatus Nanoarchaeia archaeon]